MVCLLRLQGIRLHVKLDDWLISADSPQMASYHAQLVIRVLRHLGWMINFQKSELIPTQDFQFIGMQFRTQAPPAENAVKKVQAILDHWCWATTVTALDVHRILGTIQYMAPLVLAAGCVSGPFSGGPSHHGTSA